MHSRVLCAPSRSYRNSDNEGESEGPAGPNVAEGASATEECHCGFPGEREGMLESSNIQCGVSNLGKFQDRCFRLFVVVSSGFRNKSVVFVVICIM